MVHVLAVKTSTFQIFYFRCGLYFNLFIPVTNLLAYTGGSEELEKVSFSSYMAFRFKLLGDRWFPIWYTAIFLSSPDRF